MKQVLSVLLFVVVGCTGARDEPQLNNATPDNEAPNNEAPNNEAPNNEAPNNDGTMMLPIELQQALDRNCISCHTSEGIGTYDFTDIDTVVAVGELMATTVENRTMPPWNVDPTCAELKGDLRLTDEQIAVFSDWVDAGKPLVAEEPFERLEPINPEIGDAPDANDEVIDAMIPEAYTPVFGRSQDYEEDDFRCFVVDPGFTEDRELTGFEVLVDNVELAHHMVVFTADGDDDNRAALAALEEQDSEPGFSCFGVSGFNVNNIAAVWAPGGGRVGFPSQQGIGQTAVEIQARSLIVIQMHYNKPMVEAGADQSGVRMWFRPPGERVHELAQADWTFVGNLPFRVPAGVDGTMVADDACDVVYQRYEFDDDPTPISPPAVGFDADEVECGIEQEDCEAQYGAGAAECAIDYSSRLRISTLDPAATYTVSIMGTDVTVDASALGASSAGEVLTALEDAINTNPALQGMVTASLRDRNGDGTMDELIVANDDDETLVRTNDFRASGTAEVWRGYVDGCAQWDPARLVEARGVGSSGCVQQEVYYRNPAPLKAWAAFSHMHLLGQRIETEILKVDDDGALTTSREDEADCAARTDAWDFDWQRTYWFEQPKTIPRRGLIRLRCRYDNSASGEEVRLGDGSGSEMCLALLYLTL